MSSRETTLSYKTHDINQVYWVPFKINITYIFVDHLRSYWSRIKHFVTMITYISEIWKKNLVCGIRNCLSLSLLYIASLTFFSTLWEYVSIAHTYAFDDEKRSSKIARFWMFFFFFFYLRNKFAILHVSLTFLFSKRNKKEIMDRLYG